MRGRSACTHISIRKRFIIIKCNHLRLVRPYLRMDMDGGWVELHEINVGKCKFTFAVKLDHPRRHTMTISGERRRGWNEIAIKGNCCNLIVSQ